MMKVAHRNLKHLLSIIPQWKIPLVCMWKLNEKLGGIILAIGDESLH